MAEVTEKEHLALRVKMTEGLILHWGVERKDRKNHLKQCEAALRSAKHDYNHAVKKHLLFQKQAYFLKHKLASYDATKRRWAKKNIGKVLNKVLPS